MRVALDLYLHGSCLSIAYYSNEVCPFCESHLCLVGSSVESANNASLKVAHEDTLCESCGLRHIDFNAVLARNKGEVFCRKRRSYAVNHLLLSKTEYACSVLAHIGCECAP